MEEKEIAEEKEPEEAPEGGAEERENVSADRGPREGRRGPSEEQEGRPRRRGRYRRRVCAMCEGKMAFVDYKDYNFLRRFISDRGRIESRRKMGTCAKHQRALAQAIKRARHLALLPYSPEHIRVSGAGVSR